MNHLKTFCVLCVLAFSLAGCAQVLVKRVDYADTPPVPTDAHPAPIKFSGIKYLLPPGTEIGIESATQLCWGPYSPVSRRAIGGYPVKFVEQTFSDALESIGYDVVNNIDIDFRPIDEIQRANYFVSARVKDVDLNSCTNSIWGKGTKGQFYLRVDWSVYDALRRTVVYKTTTEGYSHRKIPNINGLEPLFFDAFDMAAHNLGADEDFYNLIIRGEKTPPYWRNAQDKRHSFAEMPRQFPATDPVRIPHIKPSQKRLAHHIDQTRQAVVTLQKTGHGSGFFISDKGHILTNQHVVGDARDIRVISADRKHSAIAEVLRVDRVRDIALLRLRDIPKDWHIQTLPIRLSDTKITEDVYAIGSPIHAYTLENTVTKGIISAHRTYKIDSIRQNYIQADVPINGGNSGGPLLDENGNVIGVSVIGLYLHTGKRSADLNLFIPIAEALGTMEIEIEGHKLPKNATTKQPSDGEENDYIPDIQ